MPNRHIQRRAEIQCRRTKATASKDSDTLATKEMTVKKTPEFDLKRCKRCGICKHFCPQEAIDVREDGTPFLANAEACTSCNLCEEMCPDWAICLTTVSE